MHVLLVILFIYCSISLTVSDMDFVGDNNYIGIDPFPEVKPNYSTNSISSKSNSTYNAVYDAFKYVWSKRYSELVLIARDRSKLTTYDASGSCRTANVYERFASKSGERKPASTCIALFDGDVDTLSGLGGGNGAGQTKGRSWWAIDLAKLYVLKSMSALSHREAPAISMRTSELMHADAMRIASGYTCPHVRYINGALTRPYTKTTKQVNIPGETTWYKITELKYMIPVLAKVVRVDFFVAGDEDEKRSLLSELLFIGELANARFNVDPDDIRYCPIMESTVNSERPVCNTQTARNRPKPVAVEVLYGFPSVPRDTSLEAPRDARHDQQCTYKLFDGEVLRPYYSNYAGQLASWTRESKWKLRLTDLRRVASVAVWLNREAMRSANASLGKNTMGLWLLNEAREPFACRSGQLTNGNGTMSRIIVANCKPYSFVPWTRSLMIEWSENNVLFVVEEIVVKASLKYVSPVWHIVIMPISIMSPGDTIVLLLYNF